MTDSAIQDVVAVFGQNVAGNPTQYVLEKGFANAGLDWRCLTFEVHEDDLADAIRGLRALGMRGCALAREHRSAAVPLVDRATPSATLAGAINCVQRDQRELVGHNTVGAGLLVALRRLIDPAGKDVVLMGAGDSARAIAVELALAGAARLTILCRHAERGQPLAALIADKLQVAAEFAVWDGDYSLRPETEIVIHATPHGRGDAEARVPLELSTLEADMVVADTVFNPPETRLVRDAKARGCQTIDGLEILVEQYAAAFQIWTNRPANIDIMRDALEEFLGL